MTITELKEAGYRMAQQEGDAEIKDSLRGLAGDPRFAAVFALLYRFKESGIAWVGDTKLANHHGSLAHCAGGVDTVLRLEQYLSGLFQKRSQGAVRPEEE